VADLRSELMAIREEYGSLTPHNVVQAATDPDHPLHTEFEWDNTIAGHKYRLDQARRLIRVVREPYVDSRGHLGDIRVFHSISRSTGIVYDPVEEIIQDDIATQVLLRSMEREWRQLKTRYDRFEEFRAMIQRDLGPDTAA